MEEVRTNSILGAFVLDDGGGPGAGKCDTISFLRFDSVFDRALMKTSAGNDNFRLSVAYEMCIIFVLDIYHNN